MPRGTAEYVSGGSEAATKAIEYHKNNLSPNDRQKLEEEILIAAFDLSDGPYTPSTDEERKRNYLDGQLLVGFPRVKNMLTISRSKP